MKNLFRIFILLVAVIGMSGCGQPGNERTDGQGAIQETKQNDGYRIVYINNDGTEEIEKIEAQNDTDAVRQYTKKVTSIVFKNLDKEDPPYKDIFVLSPSGEKLNKNKSLMNAAAGNIKKMADEADDMSRKLEMVLKLTEDYEKAIASGNMKKADSIKVELDKIEVK